MVLGARVFVTGFLPAPVPGKVALKTPAGCHTPRPFYSFPRDGTDRDDGNLVFFESNLTNEFHEVLYVIVWNTYANGIGR